MHGSCTRYRDRPRHRFSPSTRIPPSRPPKIHSACWLRSAANYALPTRMPMPRASERCGRAARSGAARHWTRETWVGITGSNYQDNWRRGRDSNPRSPVRGTTVFETAPFDRSGTSPINGHNDLAWPGREHQENKARDWTQVGPNGFRNRALHVDRVSGVSLVEGVRIDGDCDRRQREHDQEWWEWWEHCKHLRDQEHKLHERLGYAPPYAAL